MDDVRAFIWEDERLHVNIDNAISKDRRGTEFYLPFRAREGKDVSSYPGTTMVLPSADVLWLRLKAFNGTATDREGADICIAITMTVSIMLYELFSRVFLSKSILKGRCRKRVGIVRMSKAHEE